MTSKHLAATGEGARKGHTHTRLVVVSAAVANGAPVTRVIFTEEDGGYLLFDADVPANPDEIDEDEVTVLCLGCVVDRHPEAGVGMDLAKRHGEAWLEGESWVVE